MICSYDMAGAPLFPRRLPGLTPSTAAKAAAAEASRLTLADVEAAAPASPEGDVPKTTVAPVPSVRSTLLPAGFPATEMGLGLRAASIDRGAPILLVVLERTCWSCCHCSRSCWRSCPPLRPLRPLSAETKSDAGSTAEVEDRAPLSDDDDEADEADDEEEEGEEE